MSTNDASGRIDILDGLRGVAIGMVLLHHVYVWLPTVPVIGGIDFLYPFSITYIGVELFFVISGFCMYYAWAKKSDLVNSFRFGDYFRRRFWRIYPPYFVALLLTIPLSLLWLGTQYTWSYFAWHLPFLHSFNIDKFYFYGTNSPLWSIAVEVQFYLVFPLIIMAANRWGLGRVVAVLLTATLVYRFGVSLMLPFSTFKEVPKPYLDGFLLARLPCFVAGIMVASLWTGKRKSFLGVHRARGVSGAHSLLLGGLAMMALTWLSIYLFRHASIAWREYGFALSFGLLVFGALHSGPWHRMLSSRWLFGLGTISYSVYLNHALVWQLPLSWFSLTLNRGPLYAWTLLALTLCFCLPIALLFSWEFYRLVEKPSIRFAHGRPALLKRSADVGTEAANKIAVPEQKTGALETVTTYIVDDERQTVGDVAHPSSIIIS